jgi:myo-inositol-1(or 4)-monophosphatase
LVDKTSFRTYLAFAHTVADLSGKTILPYFRRSLRVTDKGGGARFDPVTAADRAAERVIRKAISARFPEHGIVGEEFTERPGQSELKWLIDPIDGTRSFIAGSPLWGTLIALTSGSDPLLGVMDQPFTAERFWSDQGKAYARAPDGRVRRLKTRTCTELGAAVLTATHPDLFSSRKEAASFERLKSLVRMTRYGGDCYGYCMLASGFVDLVVEAGLKAYDIAPLIPIIEGAGGVVTTWDGGSALNGGEIVAAGDARVHRKAVAVLNGA